MAERRIEMMPLSSLLSQDRNPRGHDPETLGASMDRFGYLQSVFIDERTGKLIAGHGRRDQLAAKRDAGEAPPSDVIVEDGEWLVPVERGWSSHDDVEAEAAGVALNRVGEGLWNRDVLWETLDDLSKHEHGLDGLGFSEADRDTFLAQLMHEREQLGVLDEPEISHPELIRPPDNPITSPGDVWLLGPHRLVCGDCRDLDTVRLAAGGRQVNVAFTSPPYAAQRGYDAKSGFNPIPEDEYVEWFAPVAANVASVLADDGSWFVNIKPPHEGLDCHLYVHDLVAAHVRQWGWHFATEFCWERNGVPQAIALRFKNQFEPVYQFARGRWKIRPDNVRHVSENAVQSLHGAAHQPGMEYAQGGGEVGSTDMDRGRAVQLGSLKVRGRKSKPMEARPNSTSESWSRVQGVSDATGVSDSIGLGWAYPGNRLPTFGSTHEAVGHSAAFPVGLPQWFVRAYSDDGDVVFDPFMGSGSTLLAAHNESRVGVGVELSPAYCDVICARFQRHADVIPVLESSGDPVRFDVPEVQPEPPRT